MGVMVVVVTEGVMHHAMGGTTLALHQTVRLHLLDRLTDLHRLTGPHHLTDLHRLVLLGLTLCTSTGTTKE